MGPLGLSIATATRTGNCLGANLSNTARHVAYTAFILSVLLACVNLTALLSSAPYLGYLFTSDEDVIKKVEMILPLGALFQINDGIGAIGGGVLRGCGHQKKGAIINLSG